MEIINPEKQYRKIWHVIYSCQYHIIFTPKYRRKVLVDGIDERLKQLILEKQEDFEYKVLDIEVMPDHVHLLLEIHPRVTPVQVVARIKGYTSKVLRQEYPELIKKLPCLWTRSCFVSTVGSVSLEVVKNYIENQKGK